MKMKNILNLVIVLFMGLASIAIASSFDPGSQQDPIVTKSYVDDQIIELKKLISSGNTNSGSNTQTTPSNFTFEAIKVNKGLSIIGKEGTEIIVRSGSTKAITYTKDGVENGLQDITDGVDLKKDSPVPLNHLIIIPRDDGRGIKFITDSYIMIRGKYNIK